MTSLGETNCLSIEEVYMVMENECSGHISGYRLHTEVDLENASFTYLISVKKGNSETREYDLTPGRVGNKFTVNIVLDVVTQIQNDFPIVFDDDNIIDGEVVGDHEVKRLLGIGREHNFGVRTDE